MIKVNNDDDDGGDDDSDDDGRKKIEKTKSVSNDRSGRCDSNGPRIIKIGAIHGG